MDSAITTTPASDVVVLHRRTIDRVLIALGLVMAIVLAVAGALLTWGKSFANDYVAKELGAQKITFPDKASLEGEQRNDLVPYAGQQVTTGKQAEAYASFIQGHVEHTADGKTYAELNGPEVAARDALTAAKTANKPAEEIAKLQADLDKISGQRNTVFKGETLRGLLLSTYAWSKIADIAGWAAIAAFIAAVLMLVLVVLGIMHLNKTKPVARTQPVVTRV